MYQAFCISKEFPNIKKWNAKKKKEEQKNANQTHFK